MLVTFGTELRWMWYSVSAGTSVNRTTFDEQTCGSSSEKRALLFAALLATARSHLATAMGRRKTKPRICETRMHNHSSTHLNTRPNKRRSGRAAATEKMFWPNYRKHIIRENIKQKREQTNDISWKIPIKCTTFYWDHFRRIPTDPKLYSWICVLSTASSTVGSEETLSELKYYTEIDESLTSRSAAYGYAKPFDLLCGAVLSSTME